MLTFSASTLSDAMHPRSACPVAYALDLIGDKWSLLIIRDLVFGKKTYSELLAAPEGITTNILADRLKRLTAEDIVMKILYQPHPQRYHYALTRKGKELALILRPLAKWSNRHYPETLGLEEILSPEK